MTLKPGSSGKKMYLFYYFKNNSFISAVNTVWKMRESNQIQKVLKKSKEIASLEKGNHKIIFTVGNCSR